ncbi:MAG: helicase-related protein [Cloacibacillus evryensis]
MSRTSSATSASAPPRYGDMSQRERNNALRLRGGRVSILVATDVAARGLDIDAVSHVLQYGLPQNLEAFVHRSGRTGRAGHEGSNLILLTAREARQFKGMIMHSGSKLKLEWIPAPDAEEIEGQARVRFENNILEHALESNEFESWAQELLKRRAPVLVSGCSPRHTGTSRQVIRYAGTSNMKWTARRAPRLSSGRHAEDAGAARTVSSART